MSGYREDLAYIHDVGFGEFALNAAPGLLTLLKKSGVPNGLVLDLGCGSGLWARELDRAGYDVWGVDISSSMVAMARKRVRRGRFLRSSFNDVTLPRCDAVTSIGECLSYLLDEQNTKAKLRRLFRRILAALRPGGVLIFDLLEPGSLGRAAEQKHHLVGDDWTVLVHSTENTASQRLTRNITAFRKIGHRYRRTDERHRLQLYERSEMLAELRTIGYRARSLGGYGSLRFRTGNIGFVARKPKF